MPQLDKISIFTEVFYLFGAFLILFIYIAYFLLPELALLLKIKTSFSQFKDQGLARTLTKVEEEYTAFLTTTVESFQADLNLVKILRVELSKAEEEAVAELATADIKAVRKALDIEELEETLTKDYYKDIRDIFII